VREVSVLPVTRFIHNNIHTALQMLASPVSEDRKIFYSRCNANNANNANNNNNNYYYYYYSFVVFLTPIQISSDVTTFE
jgi:hypothetical protein